MDSADRLLPADTTTRALARELYEQVKYAAIISPHGHVPAAVIRDNDAFADAGALFVSTDHYVLRLLHADGVDLSAMGVNGVAANGREVWAALVNRWHLFAGTASGYWIADTLREVFGIDDLDQHSAEDSFDIIAEQLAEPDFRPRPLLDRFNIAVLATTDDPLDDLAAHQALATDPTVTTRVLPTFRPDAYLDPAPAAFAGNVERLLGQEAVTYANYLDALRRRRAHFISCGAVSVDVGVRDHFTADLDPSEASALFQRVLAGTPSPQDARLFRGQMVTESASMSVDDGLVLTLHGGVQRSHSGRTLAAVGPDSGHDIPLAAEYTQNLRPLLDKHGLDPRLHLIVFGLDETATARELAPLAGFYPSLYIGAPWWFLDAPDAIYRHRSSVVETAGFYRGSGFIDDTRAFLSIPTRHDMSRRADAAFLARYVVEGRITASRAHRIIEDLVTAIPMKAFRL